MLKYLFAGLALLPLSSAVFAQETAVPAQKVTTTEDLADQGFTPFIVPTRFPPEQGIPFIKNDPAYPKYLEIYGAIQLHYGSRAELEPIGRQVEQLQKDYPKSPYPLYALAELKYGSWQHSQGNVDIRAILRRAADLGGDVLPDGYILEAKMAANEGYYASALSSARRAVRFAPDKPEARFALARAQDGSRNFAEAEEAYRAFISLEADPRRKANGYFWLAQMFSDSRLSLAQRATYRDKARDAWRQASEIGHNYSDLMMYGDFLLTSDGDYAAAAAVFGKLPREYQDDASVRYRMALINYLMWAKSGRGATAAAFKAVETRDGMPAEHAFVVSAAFDGLNPVTRAMLRNKLVKNVNAVCEDTPFNLPGNATALDMAAFSGNAALVKELAEHGASVNSATDRGATPLLYAVHDRDVELTAYLLKKGARVNVTNAEKENPMNAALRAGPNSRQLVSLLLKYHADPMALNNYGVPAPVAAVWNDNVEGLDTLITEARVNVETRDKVGTLLGHAATRDNPVVLRYLISKGANPWAEYAGGDMLNMMQNAYMPPNASKEDRERIAESIAIMQEARKQRPQQ